MVIQNNTENAISRKAVIRFVMLAAWRTVVRGVMLAAWAGKLKTLSLNETPESPIWEWE